MCLVPPIRGFGQGTGQGKIYHLSRHDIVGIDTPSFSHQDLYEFPIYYDSTLSNYGVSNHQWAHPIDHIILKQDASWSPMEKLSSVFHQTVVSEVDHQTRTGTIGIILNKYVPSQLIGGHEPTIPNMMKLTPIPCIHRFMYRQTIGRKWLQSLSLFQADLSTSSIHLFPPLKCFRCLQLTVRPKIGPIVSDSTLRQVLLASAKESSLDGWPMQNRISVTHHTNYNCRPS